ncbi:MAG: transporter substrate-binding domain-containing protein [Oscillospiraceae bacterium]|nr:transporter substrate-binding domain-containing protein [Oscillospiraceae bacterium]
MKKLICGLLSALLMLSLFSACSDEYKEPPQIGFLVAQQFGGYKLGTVDGLVDKKVITDNIDSPDIKTFASAEKGVSALKSKKIHGMVLPTVYIKNELENSDNFEKLYAPFVEKDIRALCLSSFESSIVVDAALTLIQNNGTADKIATAHSPYAKNAKEPYARPEIVVKRKGATITIGICSDDNYPFNYRAEGGSLVGVNADVAHEIAAYMGRDLIIKEYSEKELLKALDNGEVDIAMSAFSPSEEEPISTKYIASHPYYDASVDILINASK